MRIPLEEKTVEIFVKKSRFIAIAKPIASVTQIKENITATRNEHPHAAHVVHAAVVGKKGDQFSYSDDQEPKNSAGRPAFEVLKGSGITNILVMIIRYFGGTLLGTGGLVRAYSDATREVLQVLKTEKLIEKSSLTIIIGYEFYEQAKLIFEENDASMDEKFETDVTIELTLPTINVEKVKEQIINLSNGKAIIK
ncbi:MAG: YigZ family protein [Sphaerochaetaceae bacterium]|jgi:uncharacterized YigZ family protein